jgi:putative tryptophan/tyrosine transport system substrate-binding protein
VEVEVRRRLFITLLGGSAVAWSLGAPAQQSRPLLAILSPARRDGAHLKNINEPFKEALAKFGWLSGRTIDIVERFADGDASRLPELAAELVALKPHVLFTNTSYAATVAATATSIIPIVVGPAGELTLTALAGGNIVAPTTNVTGFVLLAPSIDDKVLSLLMEAVPTASRIGVLVNPDNPEQQQHPAALKDSRSVPGKTLVRIESRGLTDIDAALAKTAAEGVDALFIPDDSHIVDAAVRRRVLTFAAEKRLPIGSSHQDYAREGAVISMGPSIPALAAAAAGYVDKILKGAKPGELPIQLPSVFSVIVNVTAAKALGLNLPPTILRRADEVVE